MKLKNEFEKYFQYVLAGIIVLGFFIAIIVFMVHDIPKDNIGSVNLLVGALIGAFSLIVSFYWGSSKGSKDKDEIISNGQ
jgi:RsiW-degrading membrane proteinase PrsW (M82 family)